MARKKKFKYPLCVFRWLDAQYDPNGSDPDEPLRPAELVTVGFLLEDNKEEGFVRFVAEYAERESWVRHKQVIGYDMLKDYEEIA